MNRITSRFVFKIASFIALFLLLGCTSPPWRAADADIETQIVSSEHMKISRVVIIEKTSGFSLMGEMYKKQLLPIKPNGHIAIDIVNSDGRILYSTATHFHRFGKINRLRKRYKFSVEVPYIPPEGSVIRVAHHEGALHQKTFHTEG